MPEHNCQYATYIADSWKTEEEAEQDDYCIDLKKLYNNVTVLGFHEKIKQLVERWSDPDDMEYGMLSSGLIMVLRAFDYYPIVNVIGFDCWRSCDYADQHYFENAPRWKQDDDGDGEGIWRYGKDGPAICHKPHIEKRYFDRHSSRINVI